MRGIKYQLHTDFLRYRRAVDNDSGEVSRPTQDLLAKFIKWCYKEGLRDYSGQDHVIFDFAIFLTENSNGFNNKIWYKSGASSKVTGTANYLKDYGCYCISSENLSPGVNANEFDTDNCTLAALCHTYHVQNSYFGYEGSNVFSVNINQYFPSTTNESIFFNIFTRASLTQFDAGWRFFESYKTDSIGFVGGVKLNTTHTAFLGRNTLTAQSSNVSIARTNGNLNYIGGDGDRFFSGHLFGKYINPSLISNLYTKLTQIQTSVSINRNSKTAYDTRLAVERDARFNIDVEAQRIATENNFPLPTFWFNPTLELRNLNTVPDSFRLTRGGTMERHRHPTDTTIAPSNLPLIENYSNGRKALKFDSTQRKLATFSNTFATNVVFIVFKPYIQITNGTERQCLIIVFHSDNLEEDYWRQGFNLGAHEPAIPNEFFTYSVPSPNSTLSSAGSNNKFYLSMIKLNNFGTWVRGFEANTDYLITMFIAGTNPLFRVNGQKSDSNKALSGNTSDFRQSGLNISVGGYKDEFSNSTFSGGYVDGEIKEVISYNYDLDGTEQSNPTNIIRVENYLINKWDINRNVPRQS